MAKKIQETFYDDIDGSEMEAPNEVRFGIDGTNYEIDLTGENEDKLRRALAPFITAARPVRAPVNGTRNRAGSAGKMSRAKATKVRRWARERGLPVSERGRISAHVVEQYDAAH